jgi:ankyrin repeat protein
VQFGHKGVVVEIYNRCRSLLTRPNSSGDSPLHVAARCGHFSIVDFLVKEILSAKRISTEYGKSGRFDILRQGNNENNTVLHEAVRNGNMSVVKLLLRVDTKLACFENYAGESPLFLAAREGKKDFLNQILISTPASAHGGSEGQTALHAAVIERHSGSVLCLDNPFFLLLHIQMTVN